MLSGCYLPIEGIRDPNPGPGAAPPWPYDPGVYPPGRNSPAGYGADYPRQPASPIQNSQTLPASVPGYGSPAGNHDARALASPHYGQPNPPMLMAQPMAQPMPQNSAFAATPPPPSQSITPQYADWLVDGPEGRSFAYYLAAGYRRYAKHQDNAHDFEDAAKFLFRAGAVDRGERVEPELLAMRTLPAYAVDDLLYARQRLTSVLNRGAAQRFPKLSASAQVHFDCWMEQQEENNQPQGIHQCRRNFEADVVRLETALIERVHAPTPCPAPAPAKAACDSTPLRVHFELGKHDLTSAGRDALQQAIESSRRAGNLPLVVSAHADRSGSDAYNDALSKRRLDTVIAALEAAGMARDKLARAEHFGERRPRIETADGVRHPENRRVEIHVACNARLPDCAAQAAPMNAACAGQPAPCSVDHSWTRDAR